MIPITPPGNSIRDLLEDRSMTQAELADRLGLSKKTTNEIIAGKAPISAETALGLEKVFGMPARFWNNREQQYRDYLARIEEQERLAPQLPWLKQIPVQEMAKRGWIAIFKDPVEQLVEVLRFYGVANVEQWNYVWGKLDASFRKPSKHESDPGALSAWLRKGKLLAQEIECKPFSEPAFRSALSQIRICSCYEFEKAINRTVKLCADAGVAFVIVSELHKTRASGVTRWLSPEKALIQLSFRYKTDNQFWFTFFHEAGHILLHGKKEVYVDDDDGSNQKEIEADQFAANYLIAQNDWKDVHELPAHSKDWVEEFAHRNSIAPGIVVGRLQKENLINYNQLNGLKRNLTQFAGKY